MKQNLLTPANSELRFLALSTFLPRYSLGGLDYTPEEGEGGMQVGTFANRISVEVFPLLSECD